MTKKHFIAVADAIREHNRARNQFGDAFSDEQISTLSVCFRELNPRFNAVRWENYIAGKCGPNGGKK
jgi:hypothetical protein